MTDLFTAACPCCGRPYEPDTEAKGFPQFWEAHPGARQNKRAAQDKYRRAVKGGVPSDTIIRAAAEYATICAERGKPPRLPVTWLNQRGWEDEHEPRHHNAATDRPQNRPDAALAGIARLAGLGQASGDGGS